MISDLDRTNRVITWLFDFKEPINGVFSHFGTFFFFALTSTWGKRKRKREKKTPNEQCMTIFVERCITNMNSKNGKSRVKSAHNFKCPNAFFTDKSTMDKRTISISISTVHGFHLVLHIVALFGVEIASNDRIDVHHQTYKWLDRFNRRKDTIQFMSNHTIRHTEWAHS